MKELLTGGSGNLGQTLVPRLLDKADIGALLGSYPSEGMVCWPVGPPVGNISNNDPSLVEPISV